MRNGGDIYMTQGDKSKYTDKQKCQVEHIEKGYEKRGISEKEAEKRAWSAVNKIYGGGEKSGSGRGRGINKQPYQRGGSR